MEIAIRIKKNGKKAAYRYDLRQNRMYPMRLADAEIALATGCATRIPVDAHKRSDPWYELPEYKFAGEIVGNLHSA
jgi:hypothetical protein